MKEEASDFVERFGLMWERLGSSRAIGRVLAWLTVCDPPEQSAADIGEALQISQAHVSTTMRTLEMMGLVERVSLRGERRIHYRIPKGAWQSTTRSRLQEFDAFIDAAKLGRDVMVGQPKESRARIDELWDWATWWRKRYGDLVDEWEQR